MKNYKDMADAVFARRDEYVASVKRKKKIALNASLSLCAICLAVLGAVGIWKSGIIEPTPGVIGTKPHSYTEPTEVTLSGNATSQGEYSDTTEHITGNSKPQNTTDNVNSQGTNPTDVSNPQSTDPAENTSKPAVDPGLPSVNPTLPTLPVIRPTLPTVKPTISTAVVTEPAETDKPCTNDSTEPNKPTVVPDVTLPPAPATDSTEPDEPNYAPPEWTAATEPSWTEAPETQAPMEEPTDAPTIQPTVPIATEASVHMVEGVVTDQYGNPVEGAVVKVYSSGVVVGTYTTNSNGYYCISDFRSSGNSVALVAVPNGYTASGTKISFSGSYNYIVLNCTKK